MICFLSWCFCVYYSRTKKCCPSITNNNLKVKRKKKTIRKMVSGKSVKNANSLKSHEILNFLCVWHLVLAWHTYYKKTSRRGGGAPLQHLLRTCCANVHTHKAKTFTALHYYYYYYWQHTLHALYTFARCIYIFFFASYIRGLHWRRPLPPRVYATRLHIF